MSNSTGATAAGQGGSSDEVYVNVEVDERLERKIVSENKAWTAYKLVFLTVGVLAISFVALYVATIWTGTWGRTIDYPNFLAPESAIPAYADPERPDLAETPAE